MPHQANAGLPVDAVLPALMAALETGNCAVLAAPPGAGKTTRVPLALAAASWCVGKVVVLEPRRIAARAAAAFMAAGLGEKPGETIGYRVRLESRTSAKTRIVIVTEGVFTRMIMDDPELDGISALVFDEFHERSLDADLGLALALDVQKALRPELRILVMSATLDTAALSSLMGNAPVIESTGRAFSVELRYNARPPGEAVEDAMERAIRQALAREEGSILAFLPGQKEIRRTASRLEGSLPVDVRLHQLYGALDARDQDAAIRPAPPGTRKVVIATAVAETSLTIDGVRLVIDSGLKRVPRYEPRTGLTLLETVRASRSAITQRAGRAGRTAPGIAIRLWREQQTASLAPTDTPQILEADLAGLALDLAAWGVGDPAKLSFLDVPPVPAWNEALQLLTLLGALDAKGLITPGGKAMRDLPLPPRFAHMVVAAGAYGQAMQAARLAVLVSERGLGGSGVDLAPRLERFGTEKGERANAARNLARSMSAGLDKTPQQALSAGALLSLAFPDRIAKSRGTGGAFRLANGRGARIDEAEPLARHATIVIADMQGVAASARILGAAAIDSGEIASLHQAAIGSQREIFFDRQSGAVRARLITRLGSLVLSEAAVEIKPEDAPHVLLFAKLRENGLAQLDWGKAPQRLRERLAFLHRHDQGWPDVAEPALLASLDDWLLPFVGMPRTFADLSASRLQQGLAYLMSLCGKSEAEASRLAPEHFVTPAGSQVALRYEVDGAFLAVRVQELFGLATHPSILSGALPLTLELLSPAHRPIQVTRDLPGFWKGSWAEVRSEMKGRYPRHAWPEHPAKAPPTSRAKPRGT